MRTRCTDGVKFGMGVDFSMPDFTPSVQRCWCGSENCKFYEVSEYQCPEGRNPWSEFYKIFGVYGHVHVLDLGIRSGGSKVMRILPRDAFSRKLLAPPW